MAKFTRIPWGKNHCCRQPSRLMFYDVETTADGNDMPSGQARHTLRLGVMTTWINRKGVWCKQDHVRFTNSIQFWRATYDFIRPRKPTWAFAHNAAFDFTALHGWSEIDYGTLRIFEKTTGDANTTNDANSKPKVWRGKTALDGNPFILETRHDRGPIKWVDTFNYWPVPLSKLGKWVGLEKITDINLDDPDKAWWQRCERDVEIIETSVIKLLNLWKEADRGNWQPTIASLAYSSFRHGKESCQIVAHGDNEHDDATKILDSISGNDSVPSAKEITAIERRGYYGGHTEVYFCGDIITGAIQHTHAAENLYQSCRPIIAGPVTVLDVNSMYPFVMREYNHPIELCDAIRHPQRSIADRLIQEFPCIADVEIDDNENEYPKRHDGRVWFSKGSYSTTLACCELSGALSRGSVKRIANLLVYYYGRPFSNFIQYWHGRRTACIESGNEIEARFCNQLMQSLYGKLAQQTPLWQTCGLTTPPVRWGGYISQPSPGEPPCMMRAIAGVSQYQTIRKACRHTFVAAAASVTAWARDYMDRLIRLCPYRSIVYMDTDSLFCLPSAVAALEASNLIHSTELGKLKVKGTYNHVRIWGHKDYELDGRRVIAGLSADADEISERVWRQVNFEGIRQTIQHRPDGSIMSSLVKFAPQTNHCARTVEWDGWTSPLRTE